MKRRNWHQRFLRGSTTPFVEKPNALMVNADARTFVQRLPSGTVDCIVTSPPYGGVKDYGSKTQLGFGQHYKTQYLPDLEGVLCELHRVAKQGAALWLILDTIKTNGESLMLPWEIAQRAQRHGWKLHDIVVWDKGRSLPWSHKGQFRGVCEFLILLGKGALKTYNLAAVRDHEDLSTYWVRYPERFNPSGKAPTDLWHFPIPIQGSWAKSALRHFCPFPLPLVNRILAISTRRGQVVLDPFAGTGSVIAAAAAHNRKGIGIELNRRFVRAFESRGFDSFVQEIQQTDATSNSALPRLLSSLRLLKYPKSLFVELSRHDRLGTRAKQLIVALVLRRAEVTKNGDEDEWGAGVLDVLISDTSSHDRIYEQIQRCAKVKPLSKFGVRMKFRVVSPKVWRAGRYRAGLSDSPWHRYGNGRFFEFSKRIRKADLRFDAQDSNNGKRKYPDIYCTLGVKLESFM